MWVYLYPSGTKTGLKNAYVGAKPGVDFEFSYNFKSGSLSWFQAAWWKDIYTNWSYSFYNDWLWQTSSNNDRYITAIVELPNLADANTLTISMEWYFIAASWSNNKWCWFWNWTTEWAYSSLRRTGELSYNTTSASYYDKAWLHLYSSSEDSWKILVWQFAYPTWNIKLTVIINLNSWVCTFQTTWSQSTSWTYTMSASEISQFKSQIKYWCASRGRWYMSENSERLHSLYIKIE